MAEFSLNENAFLDAVDIAMLSGTELLLQKVLEKVPRDVNNLPIHNVNRKDWKKPQRNVRKNNKYYYRPVQKINWNWYNWVSWNLKRSIDMQKLARWEYIVWVKRWPTEVYAGALEFSELKKVNRSFLRKPLKGNAKEILDRIQKNLNSWLK